MNRWLRWLATFLILTAACAEAGPGEKTTSQMKVPCSDSWERFIEANVPTGDGQGHGPDIGSEEWKSVVEFKLGIRGGPEVPKRDSQYWCRHVDRIVRDNLVSSAGSGGLDRRAKGAGPSFACDEVEAGSIEGMICGDEELSALDRKLAAVYAAASSKGVDLNPPLKAEQRGWIKGRNDCWKSNDKRGCVRDAYVLRIAELQARYALVPYTGPVGFICDGNPPKGIVVLFFQTDPPTLTAELGDSVSLMYLQPSASGTKYQGRNVTFWEHQSEASITWGYGATALRCEREP